MDELGLFDDDEPRVELIDGIVLETRPPRSSTPRSPPTGRCWSSRSPTPR